MEHISTIIERLDMSAPDIPFDLGDITEEGYVELRSAEERLAWDIYFASVCAMNEHPGNRQGGAGCDEMAVLADAMILQRRKRLCPGSSQ